MSKDIIVSTDPGAKDDYGAVVVAKTGNDGTLTIVNEVVDTDPYLLALNELIFRLASYQQKIPFHPNTTLPQLIQDPNVKWIGYFIDKPLHMQIEYMHQMLTHIADITAMEGHFKRTTKSIEYPNGTKIRVIDFRDHHERYQGYRFDAIFHYQHGILYPVGHTQLGE